VPHDVPAVYSNHRYASSVGEGDSVGRSSAASSIQSIPDGYHDVALLDHHLPGPFVGLISRGHCFGNLDGGRHGEQIGERLERGRCDEILFVPFDRQRQDRREDGAITAKALSDDQAVRALGQSRDDNKITYAASRVGGTGRECYIDGQVDLANNLGLMIEGSMSGDAKVQRAGPTSGSSIVTVSSHVDVSGFPA